METGLLLFCTIVFYSHNGSVAAETVYLYPQSHQHLGCIPGYAEEFASMPLVCLQFRNPR